MRWLKGFRRVGGNIHCGNRMIISAHRLSPSWMEYFEKIVGCFDD